MTSSSEKVNRSALLMDIKAVLYEIHRSDLAEVSIGDSFDSLLRAGSRHGVHNPGEFFLLTRTFVILESMIRQLDPDHDYLKSFREEIARLTAQHFSLARIKEKTNKFVREMERLMSDAPGDTRRVLRRIAEGDLGRLQAPAIEALGGRVSRNLERLTGAIVSAGLIIGGSTMITTPEVAWHHYLGEILVFAGVLGAIIITIGALRRDHGRR
jgi:ubiquinone biosynthesis protein